MHVSILDLNSAFQFLVLLNQLCSLFMEQTFETDLLAWNELSGKTNLLIYWIPLL